MNQQTRKPDISSAPALPQFFETLQRINPFRSNRVSSVPRAVSADAEITIGEEFIDVPSLHQKEFRRLRAAVNEVRQSQRSLGIILSGQAGVGKSHLLAKLCRRAELDRSACFVFLHNVIASPERMPRHFLRSVVSVLVEGRESYRDCWLYRLVKYAIRHTWTRRGYDTDELTRLSSSKARQVLLDAAQERSLSSNPINSQVFEVLFKFFEQVNRNPTLTGETRQMVDAIVDWLSGDAISESAAGRIGVAIDSEEGEDAELVRLRDESHIEQVLLILTELAAMSGITFLICLDQFDNLSDEQVRSISRFLHTLVDHSRNLLMITAGVREKMEALRRDKVISDAQWDRMGQQETTLHFSSPKEMRDLIDARLRPIRERFRHIPQLSSRFEHHQMFPLAEKDFELRFGSAIEVRPRDVLSWAAEAWMDQQDSLEDEGPESWLEHWDVVLPADSIIESEEIDRIVARALNEMIEDRREHPGALPPDADNLAVVTEKLLRICAETNRYSIRSVKTIQPAGNNLPSYHLEVTEEATSRSASLVNGVAFLTCRNGNSAQHALKRFRNVTRKLDRRILVTDEERAPLPRTKVAMEHYQALEQLGDGFRHIRLDFHRYAELDALRSVIDQAGDLVVERAGGNFTALSRDEVITSLIRQERLLRHPLLQELLEEPVNPDPKSLPLPGAELIEMTIRGRLGFAICVTSNAITTEILSRADFTSLAFEDVHDLVVRIGERFRETGQFVVKDHLNGLLFMTRG